jgi:hypothetical protein
MKSRNEAILENMLGAANEIPPPQSRIEILLQQLLEAYGGMKIKKCTQAEYDAIETPDEDTIYIIAG